MLLNVILLFIGCGIAASDNIPFFRRDYKYFENFNAFYKLHWSDNPATWADFFLACDNEGANFFYIEAEGEWQVAANLTSGLTMDIEDIYIGVHDEIGKGDFLTTDGHFLPEFSKYFFTNRGVSDSKCVVMAVNTGAYSIDSCSHRRPFICKKSINELCPTIDNGYRYSKIMKKCYKVNEREKTWEDAMHTCFMEGGLLSTAIHNEYVEVISQAIKVNNDYFVGFRRISNGDFYTLKGQKVDVYSESSDKNCGVFSFETHNNYNNEDRPRNRGRNCYDTLPFICEIEPSL